MSITVSVVSEGFHDTATGEWVVQPATRPVERAYLMNGHQALTFPTENPSDRVAEDGATRDDDAAPPPEIVDLP